MLQKLTIQNFVIAESLEINFEQGLTVLTGETGAGKSLILDAIMGVLGQRLSSDTIRQGAEYAYLEAVFEAGPAVREVLRQRAHEELLDAEHLVLSKTIHPSGSRSRLNGQLVTQALVRELATCLLDSLGQHENQSLFQEERHLSMLDALGEDRHENLKARCAEAYQQLSRLGRELEMAREQQREQERQKDFLAFQLQEIQEAELQASEEEDLRSERERLRHAEKLVHTAAEVYAGLNDSGPYAQSVCEQLEGMQRTLTQVLHLDAELEPLSEQLESALIVLQDVSATLGQYCEAVVANPQRLEELEQRLDQIGRLKQKYGESIPSILSFAQELEHELEVYAQSDERLQTLEQELGEAQAQYQKLSAELYRARQKLARQLVPQIERELKELGMPKARFDVSLEHHPERIHADGTERVRFLLSPNPGEPLRALSKTASGGEASRLLLAFKLVLKQSSPVSSLIFDEIDAGISGKTALIVSQKLARLAQDHQVLCISHLPVIAAMADQQLWIEKTLGRSSTYVHVQALSEALRLERLAQMSSGQVTDSGLEGAREIFQAASNFKSDIATLKLCA